MAQAILMIVFGEQFAAEDDSGNTVFHAPAQPDINTSQPGYIESGNSYDKTVIECELPDNIDNARLDVYDELGRKVKCFILHPGSNSAQLLQGELHNGVYLCSLIIDNTVVETKKIVIINSK